MFNRYFADAVDNIAKNISVENNNDNEFLTLVSPDAFDLNSFVEKTVNILVDPLTV